MRCLILTEWKEFVHPDFKRMKKLLRTPVIFDGRNVYGLRHDGPSRLHLLLDRTHPGRPEVSGHRRRADCRFHDRF